MASVRTPATGGSAARAPQTPALAAEVEALDRESLASLAAARRAVARLSTENGQLREALAAAQRDAARAALSDERLRAARARDEATLERWRQEIEGARDRDRRDATERGREATRVRAAFRARLTNATARTLFFKHERFACVRSAEWPLGSPACVLRTRSCAHRTAGSLVDP